MQQLPVPQRGRHLSLSRAVPDSVEGVGHEPPVDDAEDGLVVTGIPDNVRIIVAGQDLVRDGEAVLVSDSPLTEPALVQP